MGKVYYVHMAVRILVLIFREEKRKIGIACSYSDVSTHNSSEYSDKMSDIWNSPMNRLLITNYSME
jgi:hypothetical protein